MSILFDDASDEFLDFDQAPLSAFPLTLTCWIKTDTVAINQAVLFLGDTGSTGQHWSLTLASTTMNFRRIEASTAANAAAPGVTADVWHHVAGVQVLATSAFGYLNGVQGVEETQSRIPIPPNRVSVGHHGDSSPADPFSGRIKWPAIYKSALSATDILMGAKGRHAKLIRRDALVWLGKDQVVTGTPNIGQMVDVIGHNLVSTVNGTPIHSVDNPFQAQHILRSRTRSRTRLAAA